jgi:hypothetical protein
MFKSARGLIVAAGMMGTTVLMGCGGGGSGGGSWSPGTETNSDSSSSVSTSGSGTDDFGKQCQDNPDCIHNSCLVATGADFGYCTTTCMDFTECPSFWSCSEVGNATSKYCVHN